MPLSPRYILHFLLLIFVLLCCSVQGSIVIDSAVAQRSNCSNDGIITVYASSSSNPILYGIKSGPVTRPLQNSSQIAGLPPGTYQVMAVNFAGDTAFKTATVTGNYKFPDFTINYTNPYCPYSGIIIGVPVPGTGDKPYKWELTWNDSAKVTTQTSDTFTGLSAGDYSLRMYDSCLSYTTKGVTLLSNYTPVSINIFRNYILNCKNDSVVVFLYFPEGRPLPVPMEAKFQTSKGTYVSEAKLIGTGNPLYFSTIVPNLTYADTAYLTLTDVCGTVTQKIDFVDSFNLVNNGFLQITDSCRITNNPTFIFGNEKYAYLTYPADGAKFQVVDSATGKFVGAGILKGSGGAIPPLSQGATYIISFSDTCGHLSTVNYTPPSIGLPMVKVAVLSQGGCRDSTASCEIVYSNFSSKPRIKILSGPATIHSTKEKFTYLDTIDFYNKYYDFDIFNRAYFTNLGAGIYRYQVSDTCGDVVVDSFTIRSKDLYSTMFSVSSDRACVGQGKLVSLLHSNGSSNAPNKLTITNLTTGKVVLYDYNFSYHDTDVVYNIDYDRYGVKLQLDSSGYFLTSKEGCQTIYDTINIPPYTPPVISYITVLKCNGQLIVILNPDSAHGVPPYRYEVINGPETFPRQALNVFVFSKKGSYLARIIDTCNNAETYTFVVDTITKPRITVNGAPCFGNNIALIGERSPYFKYVWQKPNGSVYRGDSLFITPITKADTGLYHIIRINHINGCVDSTLTTYMLTGSLQTELNRTICTGQTIAFGGHNYNTTGTYSDTFPTPNCDSIAILNLSVVDHLEESASVTLCAGESITEGVHSYSQTGIYRDTFTTPYCDSIFILNLTVNPVQYDSLVQSICPGGNIQVGVHTYSTEGIYRDTLTGINGCDSVVVLNLTVLNLKYDSVAQSICANQQVTVGSHHYSKSGIYHDTIPTITCDSIHVLNLTVNTLKYDSVAQSICVGQSILINGHLYEHNGIYRDTFATASCDSVHVLNLTVNPLKYDSVTQSICQGQSLTIGGETYSQAGIYRDTFPTTSCDSIHVLNLTVNFVKYDSIVQSICQGESITVGQNTYNQAAIYRDTFATSTCDSVHVLNLVVNPLPVLIAESDKASATVGDKISLTASPGNLLYAWSPAELLDDSSSRTPIATMQVTTWFVVTGTDPVTSCKGSDSILVEVSERNCNTLEPAIPTAFSPNNDNRNDFFQVLWPCDLLSFKIDIWNRWGQKVFESSDKNFKWNGTYNDAMQPTGTFIYVVIATRQNGSIAKYQGAITLLH